jgi:parallel beta-helix repeat protein/adhesin HecA-like repeat protein
MKKWIICVFVCMLMIVSTIVPVSGTTVTKKTSQPLTRGNILYVGGSGPNNYTKIQDAINNAVEGDTVFVYDDSSPYYEALQVDRSISLIGEGKLTTIIDGGTIQNASVLNISAEGVVVQGFTLQNSSATEWLDNDAGIIIIADNVLIKDNIIRDHHNGVQIGGWVLNTSFEANHCLIEDNEITQNNYFGIMLIYGNYTTISHNRISSNTYGGICLSSYSNSNLITSNEIIENDGFGISLNYVTNNTVLQNNITGNRGGVYIMDSNKNSIQENNIYRNGLRNAWMYSDVIVAVLTKSRPLDNTWDGNYWGRARQLPKPIFVYSFFLLASMILSMTLQPFSFRTGSFFLIPLGFFMVKFDWHPAQEPYDISLGG